MKQLTLALALVVAFGLIACSSSSDEATTTSDTPANAETSAQTTPAERAAVASVMEVACGSCVYKMDGVASCVAATKVNGKPMLITGMEIDAMGLGLCSGPKQAQVAGHAHGDSYHATAFALN